MARYSMGQQIKKEWSLYNEMRLELPSFSMNEGMARAAVAAFCAQADPSAVELADIKCALSEAVTNCIVHAYSDRNEKDKIVIDCFTENTENGGVLHIGVEDFGKGIEDVEQALSPFFTTLENEERSGMGFTIMQTFMTEFSVKSEPKKGTRIEMKKKIGA